MSDPIRPVRKAVIPAAGLGTRFLPATKAMPKEMLPIVDKPVIQYVVEEALAAGIEDVLIVTGRGKRAIEDHFDKSIELEVFLEQGDKDSLLDSIRAISNLCDIHFIRQKEPLGLGHAILQARRHVGDEPFAVLLGDEFFSGSRPVLSQLIERWNELGRTVLATREVNRHETRRYGIIDGEPAGPGLFAVRDLIEKPSPEEAPSRWAIFGRYVIEPRVFDLLSGLAPGVGGEIQLTDALRLLAVERGVYASAVSGIRYDVGERLGFLQATVELALGREDLREPFLQYLRRVVEVER